MPVLPVVLPRMRRQPPAISLYQPHGVSHLGHGSTLPAARLPGRVEAAQRAGPLQNAAVGSYQLMAAYQRGSDDQPVSGVGVEVGKRVGPYANLAVNRNFDEALLQEGSTPCSNVV